METLPAAALPLRVLRRGRQPRRPAGTDVTGRQGSGIWKPNTLLYPEQLLLQLHPNQQHQVEQPLRSQQRCQNQHQHCIPNLPLCISRSSQTSKPNNCFHAPRLSVRFTARHQTLYKPLNSKFLSIRFSSARQQTKRRLPLPLERGQSPAAHIILLWLVASFMLLLNF